MNCQLFLSWHNLRTVINWKIYFICLRSFFLEFYAFFHWISCMYLFSWAGCELLHSECKFLTMSLNFAETMLISNKFWRLLKELVNVHEIVLIFSSCCCIKCAAFAKVAIICHSRWTSMKKYRWIIFTLTGIEMEFKLWFFLSSNGNQRQI